MRVNLKANHLDVMAMVVRATPGGYGLKLAREIMPLEIVRQNYAGLEHLRRLPRLQWLRPVARQLPGDASAY